MLCIVAIATNNVDAQKKIKRFTEKENIEFLITDWHLAATNAAFDNYFKYMADDAIYIGTDPTENWNMEAFKKFCKPYFDKKKTWNFKALERNIYMNEDKTIAWFDELLTTQMKLCRGSGILRKADGEWKIVHYVLSISIPNALSSKVTKLKTKFDDSIKTKVYRRIN